MNIVSKYFFTVLLLKTSIFIYFFVFCFFSKQNSLQLVKSSAPIPLIPPKKSNQLLLSRCVLVWSGLFSSLQHICRSATLAGWGELYGRTGYNYIFSGKKKTNNSSLNEMQLFHAHNSKGEVLQTDSRFRFQLWIGAAVPPCFNHWKSPSVISSSAVSWETLQTFAP